MIKMLERYGKWLIGLLMLMLIPGSIRAQHSDSVDLVVDFSKPREPISPIWAWFGYDEPNYTYMPGGRKLLDELARSFPVPVHVRVHNLLTSGDGKPALKWGSTNVFSEDVRGNPVYDWTIVDRIMDTYVERGMKPLVEIGFMPEALTTSTGPYRHHWAPDKPYQDIYTGWAYPPKDYNKWEALVRAWVTHSIERYGRAEVESWDWELWNEPDIGYWQGTREEFFKLYDYTMAAVRSVLPTARVGGPNSTGPSGDNSSAFLRAFLEHCRSGKNYKTGGTGSPLDFVAFHAKGAPVIEDGHVRMNLGRQLRDIAAGFDIVASFPEFKRLPIILGESDPEGCAACSVAYHPHNAYRNGTLYSSYTAASIPRILDLAGRYGVTIQGAVTWAFEFENQPWFAGFRSLATNGVDKPVLNVFRMLGMMQGNRVPVSGGSGFAAGDITENSVRGDRPDVDAMVTRTERGAGILVWNYHDDNVPAPDTGVRIQTTGLPDGKVLVHHYRIDSNHSNAYEEWKRMGSPQSPTEDQIRELERVGQLHLLTSPEWVSIRNGELAMVFSIPRQGVSYIKLDWQDQP